MTVKLKNEVKEVKEWIKVALTEEELSEASKKLAQAYSTKRRIDIDLEGIKKRFKADLEKQESVIATNSELINCEFEYRTMPCLLTFDWGEDTKTLTREDTGEILWEKPIETHERQKTIKAV